MRTETIIVDVWDDETTADFAFSLPSAVVDVQVEQPSLAVVITAPVGPPGPAGEDGTEIAVGPTPPPSPAVNDLWVDTT